MNRRAFVTGLGALFAAPSAGLAAPLPKGRVVYLAGRQGSMHNGFEEGLTALGYVIGQDLIVEYRWYEGQADRAKTLLGDIVRENPDLIVVVGPIAILTAKASVTTIPVVFVHAQDPVSNGLVTSLSRPGGNMTGLAFAPTPELGGKSVEILREAHRRLSLLGVLWNPGGGRGVHDFVEHADLAARRLGISTKAFTVRDGPDIPAAFNAIRMARADGLVVLPDPVTVNNHRDIIAAVERLRLPAVYLVRQFAEAGGLISYGPNLGDQIRRAAAYVDRILKGARPADLPVEQPTKLELVINLKTAKSLGLTIPPSLLLRADQVIE